MTPKGSLDNLSASDYSSSRKSTLLKSRTEQLPALSNPFVYGFTDIGRALRWSDKGRAVELPSNMTNVTDDDYQQAATKSYKYPLLVVFLFAMFFTADKL